LFWFGAWLNLTPSQFCHPKALAKLKDPLRT